MRPRRLRLRAFGPFADAQEIDFAELGDRSLFLIHGPTGSGKSSILDAITFALYGESSGGERSVREVRSHHVGPDEGTEVELLFTVGETTYRVRREPEQERPRKRGGGVTRAAARAELHRLVVSGRGETWKPIAARPAAVTEAVERLLGVEADQFRQVVVLPQGQFRRLLCAGSEERERILAVLFQTHAYAAVQEALKRAARDLRVEIERLVEQRRAILEDAEASSPDDLERELAQLRESVAVQTARIEELRAAEGALADRRDSARAMQERFRELEAARERIQALDARRAEAEGRSRTLERARRAEALGALARDAASRARAVRQRREATAELETGLEGARAALARAAADLARERDRAPELERARRRVADLAGLERRARELHAAQADLSRLEAELRDVDGRARSSREELAAGRLAHRQMEAELGRTRLSAARVEACTLRLEEAVDVLAAAGELEGLGPQLAAVGADLAAMSAALEEVGTRLKVERERLLGLRAAESRAGAARLAEALVPGEACPVCGSTDHPSPAPMDPAAPQPHEVDAVEAEVARLEEEQDRLRQRATELERGAAALQGRQAAAAQRVGDRARAGAAAAREVEAAAREELGEAERASERVEALQRQTEAEAGRLVQLEADLGALEERSRELGSRAAEVRGVVAERGREVPEELRAPDGLVNATGAARSALARLEASLAGAVERSTRAEQEAALAEERLRTQQAELGAATEALARIDRELDERLAAAGFSDRGDLEGAGLSAGEIAALETEHADFLAAVRSAEERLGRAVEATRGQVPPDLEPVEHELAEMRQQLEAAAADLGRLSERMARRSAQLEALARRSDRAGQLERRFEVVGTLAEVANDRAMPFERWVLATMLDEVLAVASDRLLVMSRSRYVLRRDPERRDRRRSGGLDLAVFDAHTGVDRSVATLSGGEAFLASLALALGLADVVQAYAGGVRLDTVFVDEGFGSLDPEALDLAVDTLVDLNQEGRLVGVISHVPELRERLDARIEVSRSDRGSRVRVRV